jgi:mRNA-degrading endonuclease RelE of RelBE toxin-antitoxin system
VLEFIQSRRFTARLGELAEDSAEEVLLEIESDLLKNPERGPIIQGTGGLRKTRAGNPQRGKGKRGGFRYMYYYVEKDDRIFLILIFSKDEQDNLTPKQKKWLKENWEVL